jgi:hypothetical protein
VTPEDIDVEAFFIKQFNKAKEELVEARKAFRGNKKIDLMRSRDSFSPIHWTEKEEEGTATSTGKRIEKEEGRTAAATPTEKEEETKEQRKKLIEKLSSCIDNYYSFPGGETDETNTDMEDFITKQFNVIVLHEADNTNEVLVRQRATAFEAWRTGWAKRYSLRGAEQEDLRRCSTFISYMAKNVENANNSQSIQLLKERLLSEEIFYIFGSLLIAINWWSVAIIDPKEYHYKKYEGYCKHCIEVAQMYSKSDFPSENFKLLQASLSDLNQLFYDSSGNEQYWLQYLSTNKDEQLAAAKDAQHAIQYLSTNKDEQLAAAKHARRKRQRERELPHYKNKSISKIRLECHLQRVCSPLSYALRLGNRVCANFLVKNGADPFVRERLWTGGETFWGLKKKEPKRDLKEVSRGKKKIIESVEGGERSIEVASKEYATDYCAYTLAKHLLNEMNVEIHNHKETKKQDSETIEVTATEDMVGINRHLVPSKPSAASESGRKPKDENKGKDAKKKYETNKFDRNRMKEDWSSIIDTMKKEPLFREKANELHFQTFKIFWGCPLVSLMVVVVYLLGTFQSQVYNTNSLQFHNHLRNCFVDEDWAENHLTFHDIVNEDEVYSWIKGPFSESLFNKMPGKDMSWIDPMTNVVGAIQFRQVRASKLTAQKHFYGTRDVLSKTAHGEKHVSTDAFGPPNDPKKYEYKDKEGENKIYEKHLKRTALNKHLYGSVKWGEEYDSCGHITSVQTKNSTVAANAVLQFQKDNWISVEEGTRLIVIDVNVYNEHLDSFAALSFKFEFWPAGGVTPSSEIVVIKFPKLYEKICMQALTITLMLILAWRGLDELIEMSLKQLVSILKIVEETDLTVDHDVYEKLFVGVNDAKIYNCRKRRKTFNALAVGVKYHNEPLLLEYCTDTPASLNAKAEVARAEALQKQEQAHLKEDEKDRRESLLTQARRLEEKGLIFEKKATMMKKKEMETKNASCCCDFAEDVKRETRNACCCCVCWLPLICKISNTENRHLNRHYGISCCINQRKRNKGCCCMEKSGCLRLCGNSILSNHYWADPWNYLEIIVVFLGVWYTVFQVDLDKERTSTERVLKQDFADKKYVSLVHLRHLTTHIQDLLAFILILTSLHLLRYLKHLPFSDIGIRITAITKLFFHKEVFPLYIVLLLFMLMFSLGFMNAFGNEMGHFGGVFTSSFTMLNVMFGDFGIDVDQMLSMNHILSPFFIVAAMFILALVLMNILIAVVSDLYENVYNESKEEYLNIADEIADYEIKQFPEKLFVKQVLFLSLGDLEAKKEDECIKKELDEIKVGDLLFGTDPKHANECFAHCLRESTWYEYVLERNEKRRQREWRGYADDKKKLMDDKHNAERILDYIREQQDEVTSSSEN